jgi:hypothetical protein
MRHRHIHISARTTADRAAVFALLADGASWPGWSPIESFELERPGDPPPEGVGAIRRFRRGRVVGRDLIVAFTPDRRLAYESLSGLPVRDYQADVELRDDASGTAIEWRASFRPKLPLTGWLLERGLRGFLGQCAEGLAAAAAAADEGAWARSTQRS